MAVIWMTDETEIGEADGTWGLNTEPGFVLTFRKGWYLKVE